MAAILNLAAILDFGAEFDLAPNQDVFSIQRPTSVPIFTLFTENEQFFCIAAPICRTTEQIKESKAMF